MGAALKNFTVRKGETFSYTFQAQNGLDGTPFVLTGYTGQGELRSAAGSSNLVVAMTVSIPSPTNGTITLSIPAATTATMREGIYEYDFFIRSASPETPLLYGKFTLIAAVSKRP